MTSSSTIRKGMQVMEYLAHSEVPRGISEISAAIDMNKSAVQRILGTFLEIGYVERAEGSRKYQLSLSIWELGSYVVSQQPVRRQVHPVLRLASQTTGCTAFLAHLSFPFLIYLDKVEGSHGRVNSSESGRRIPIGSTASGLSVLAFVPKELLAKVVQPSTDWTSFVKFEGLSLSELQDPIAEVRRKGFACSFSAMTRGVNAVAAPIWWNSSVPYGSLVLTADETKMPSGDIDSFGQRVRELADDVTIALGGIEARRAAEKNVQ